MHGAGRNLFRHVHGFEDGDLLAGVPDSREALEQGLLDGIEHREGRQVADRFDQIQEFQIGLRVMGSHLHVAKYVVSTLLKSRELWRGNGLNYRP